MKVANFIGQQFNKWSVIAANPEQGKTNLKWICKCECGRTGKVSSYRLTAGLSKGCRWCADKTTVRIRPFEALFNRTKSVTTREGKEFSLSYDEFLSFTQITHCHYCNEQVTWTKYCLGKNGSRYNLDRKDNDKGYTVDNVVVCCKRCNQAKGNRFTYDLWYRMTECLRNK